MLKEKVSGSFFVCLFERERENTMFVVFAARRTL